MLNGRESNIPHWIFCGLFINKARGMSDSIKEMLVRSANQFGAETAMLQKKNKVWVPVTYGRLFQRVRSISQILQQHGVQHGDRVALWRENHPEWVEAYLGIVCMGAVAVPIDAKLRPQEATHIFQDSQARVLFTGARYYPQISEIEEALEYLEVVIITDLDKAEPDSDALTYRDYHASIEEAWPEADGVESAFDDSNVRADDLASLIYTSGTTGRAKGVMLSHGNFMSNVNGAGNIWPFGKDDNFLLVLPLHHAFAFTGNMLLPLSVGATISFVQNLRTVGDNMRELRPTFFMAVPLLLEKMYNKMQDGLKTNKTATLMMKVGLGFIVRKGIAKKLGGRMKVVITGAAPCDPEIIVGFRKLGIHVLEGYGLTEASPVLTANLPGKTKPGTVGVPFTGVDIKIKNPNENGVGEVVARGANIMKGYFNLPEATEEVMDGEWLLTGDLGVVDEDGYLTITGRKKSLIVNREGKNIYPEEVELAINQSPYILECLVLGYQEKDQQVGERVGVVVVPDLERLGVERPELALKDEALENLVKEEVKRQVSALSDYKRPRQIRIRYEEFQKTSTQKVKRYLYKLGMEEL